MEFIESMVGTLNGFLWSYVLIIMLIGLGLWQWLCTAALH